MHGPEWFEMETGVHHNLQGWRLFILLLYLYYCCLSEKCDVIEKSDFPLELRNLKLGKFTHLQTR